MLAAVLSGAIVLQRNADTQAARLQAAQSSNLPWQQAQKALAAAEKALATAEAAAGAECSSGRGRRCEALEQREKAARQRVATVRSELVGLGAHTAERPIAAVMGGWAATFDWAMAVGPAIRLELAAPALLACDKGDLAAAAAIEHEVAAMNAHVGRALAAARAVGPRKGVGTSTPLEPLLQRLVGVMKRLPRGAELEWSVSATPESIHVATDHRDLEGMLGNLLDNGRKWARSRVEIRVHEDNGAVRLTVDDDGPGIAQDEVEEVMAHGARLDRAVPGTGIGLAIVQDLVALHGGSVALSQSALGGVRVAVRLPN